MIGPICKSRDSNYTNISMVIDQLPDKPSSKIFLLVGTLKEKELANYRFLTLRVKQHLLETSYRNNDFARCLHLKNFYFRFESLGKMYWSGRDLQSQHLPLNTLLLQGQGSNGNQGQGQGQGNSGGNQGGEQNQGNGQGKANGKNK